MTAAAFAECVQSHRSANRPPVSFHPNEMLAAYTPLAVRADDDAGPDAASVPKLPPMEASPGAWPEPERLTETLPEVAAFDPDLLPNSIRPLVRDISERMQVSFDFPAICAIATLAGVTNRRARIQPKINDDSWKVVPNLWGGIVAPPGMMKSPVISAVTQIAAAIETEWRKAHDDADFDYQRAADEQKLKEAAWKEQYKAAQKHPDKESPKRPESRLVQPVCQRLITSDATFEKLHELLSENPAGLFQVRDELTGWLAGLERQGREQERAFFLECWNGDSSHTIDRIGRGSVFVPHACVSQFGGIQPARLRAYLDDALRDGPSNDGLIQRFQILIWPDAPPDWSYIDRKPDAQAIRRVDAIFRRIAAMDASQPLLLRFDPAAQVLFEVWLTELERRIRGEDMAPALRGHLSKYRSLMPSLALLFALADGHTELVPLAHAQQACDWCDYLETHARRVYASQARPERDAAISLSGRLAKGWKRDEGTFTLRDVYRNEWAGLTSPDEARKALEVLEEYGWVRQVGLDDPKGTGRPTERYLRNPRIEARRAGK